MNLDSSPYWGGGKSAYDIWIEQGNTGSEQDFLKSLTGPKGEKGEQGIQGIPGPNKIANNLTTTDESYALSAPMGKLLLDTIYNNSFNFATDPNIFHHFAERLDGKYYIVWPLTMSYVKLNNLYICEIILNMAQNSAHEVAELDSYYAIGIRLNTILKMMNIDIIPRSMIGIGSLYNKEGIRLAYAKKDTDYGPAWNPVAHQNGYGIKFQYDPDNNNIGILRVIDEKGSAGAFAISKYEVGTVITGTWYIMI